jgi:hypothetical protein
MAAMLAAWCLTYCFIISGRLVESSYPSIVIQVSCINTQADFFTTPATVDVDRFLFPFSFTAFVGVFGIDDIS